MKLSNKVIQAAKRIANNGFISGTGSKSKDVLQIFSSETDLMARNKCFPS